MEHIYVATSPQFEGLVKIGRTDREVNTRMKELEGYGDEAFEGESSWSTDENHILIVEDNNIAESLLHSHFSDLRLSESRELFISSDPQLIVDEALEVTGAQILADISDSDLYGSIVEEIAEWGVTIAGALTVGAVGMVLANRLHSKFKTTRRYQVAVQRGKDLIASQEQTVRKLYEQPHGVLGALVIKARASCKQTILMLKKDTVSKSENFRVSNASKKNRSESELGRPFKMSKYLLGSFSSTHKAKNFVNRNPKLVIQRISNRNTELWGVYIWQAEGNIS